jgi:hypothetical protein
MTDSEIGYTMDAIEKTAIHLPQWKKDYAYIAETNEYSKSNMEEKENLF